MCYHLPGRQRKGTRNMEVYEFGKENNYKIVLIPGNMMCWKQFEPVIPLLAQHYHVIAISTDGYDGTGKTIFTTAENTAEKLESYIKERLNGEIELVFGESFGSATAGMLFHRQKVNVKSMIMSGPQYMNIGIFSKLLTVIVPRNQFKLLKRIQSAERLPLMLRLYTRGDDAKLLNQFKYAPNNVSLETLKNCVEESLALYKVIDSFTDCPNAKVSIWYGENEPNMKKAIRKLKRAFPSAETHAFASYGHGEIMSHPDEMASCMIDFIEKV